MLLDQEKKKPVEVPNTTPIRASATRTRYGANLLRPRFHGSGWHNLMGAETWQAPSHPALVEIHTLQVPTPDAFSIGRTYVPLGPCPMAALPKVEIPSS